MVTYTFSEAESLTQRRSRPVLPCTTSSSSSTARRPARHPPYSIPWIHATSAAGFASTFATALASTEATAPTTSAPAAAATSCGLATSVHAAAPFDALDTLVSLADHMDGMGGVGVSAIGLIPLLCGCGMVGGMVGLEEDHAGCRRNLTQMLAATSCWPLQLQPGAGRHARKLPLIDPAPQEAEAARGRSSTVLSARAASGLRLGQRAGRHMLYSSF